MGEALALFGLAKREHHLVGAERLGHVVVRTLLHGGERRLFAAVGAHHDDKAGTPTPLVRAQERQPVHVRHPHVAQHDVERFPQGALERSGPVALGRHFVPCVGEQ